MPQLSVIVPCYNERATITEIIKRVRASAPEAEIIVVDDGSTDGSREILGQLTPESHPAVRVLLHETNKGKGAALHTGFDAAGGDILQEQLQLLVYRLQADPDLIDRYFRAMPAAPDADLFRAGAKLKILGHALECLGYAQAHGLWQPNPPERKQIEQAVYAVRDLLAYIVTLDLAAIRRRQAQLGQQVVGDTCHAFRGLSLV